VFIIFGVLVYLKHENDWDFDFFWPMLIILMIINSIVVKSKSGFKDDLEKDHAQLVDYFSKFHVKN